MALFILTLPLLPVLIPATVTAFHALAGIRRRRTDARAVRDRVGYVAAPIPASA